MPARSIALFLLPVLAQQNVVLLSTNPDIIYNPPLCTSSISGCTSPWQMYNDATSGTTVVYTEGPISQAGNVIPQMFLNFRASTLYLSTTSSSNATVNFTLTAEPTDVTITTPVNTSIDLIIAENIPETQLTTLGITFILDNVTTRFDVESITLTVSNASATSSYLPSASLPPSSSPPVYVPTASSTPSSGGSIDGAIIGGVLGGVFGALALVGASVLVYRYRKRDIRALRSGLRGTWRRR